jgi:hypothetical protein
MREITSLAAVAGRPAPHASRADPPGATRRAATPGAPSRCGTMRWLRARAEWRIARLGAERSVLRPNRTSPRARESCCCPDARVNAEGRLAAASSDTTASSASPLLEALHELRWNAGSGTHTLQNRCGNLRLVFGYSDLRMLLVWWRRRGPVGRSRCSQPTKHMRDWLGAILFVLRWTHGHIGVRRRRELGPLPVRGRRSERWPERELSSTKRVRRALGGPNQGFRSQREPGRNV